MLEKFLPWLVTIGTGLVIAAIEFRIRKAVSARLAELRLDPETLRLAREKVEDRLRREFTDLIAEDGTDIVELKRKVEEQGKELAVLKSQVEVFWNLLERGTSDFLLNRLTPPEK